MKYYLHRYGLIAAALYSLLMLFLPFGIYFAPIIYTLILIAIYLRELTDSAKRSRNDMLTLQNSLLEALKAMPQNNQEGSDA